MIDEPRYLRLVTDAFKRIEDALEDVDPAAVDLDAGGDVLTLTMANGVRCVVNTQRPTRQIWLAARANAWHFSFDEASSTWLDDKGRGDELFATLGKIVKEHAATDVTF
jgi:CyaY protein